ncbi:MAG: RNA 2',3'-cyclic phosphodiesterase [Chloroflexi bacterium]|nr:RNA 2',3'-cyclic phosphodiesterase [Chloroflexota bacterium]
MPQHDEMPLSTADSETVRAFVAIELPESVKHSLAELQAYVKKRIAEAVGQKSADKLLNWTKPQGIHLTLKFLGNVPAGQIQGIGDAVSAAVAGQRPFVVSFAAAGAFPSLNRPRVIWVGVDGDLDALRLVQKRIDDALQKLGFAPETRPFSPHLTLARIREGGSTQDIRLIGQSVRQASEANLRIEELPVEEISLMRSELSRAGARYSQLAAFRLAK